MIKRIDVLVSFPYGAYFSESPTLMIYKKFIQFIKSLSCVAISTKCKTCTEKSICRYYEITGENFQYYPGISMKMDLFEKKRYKKNEQIIFSFYIIGNQTIHIDYISLFFDNLQQELFNNFFYLKGIKITDLVKKNISLKEIHLLTLISQENFKNEYNEMVNYFNKIYNTSFNHLSCEISKYETKAIIMNNQKLITKLVKPKGYIGNYYLLNDTIIDERLLTMGIGKYFYLGGGKIENKNHSTK